MAKLSSKSLHVESAAGMLAAPGGGCTDNVDLPSLTIHPPCSDEQVPKAIYPIQYPRIPGHEIIGEVVAVSPNEKKWKIGDRIGGGWHGGHCNECARCRVGDYITCEQEDINGKCYS